MSVNFKKIVFTITLCLSLFIFGTLSFATAYVSDWYDDYVVWNENCRGARISLYDIDTQSKLKSKDVVDIPYEECTWFRKLSSMAKPEVIELNGVISEELFENIKNRKSFADNLSKESLDLPEMFKRVDQDDATRITNIAMWCSNADNIKKIFDILKVSNKDVEKWNDKKACLLIEPLFIVHTLMPEKDMWALTTAELGLLAYNGYTNPDSLFPTKDLSSTAFHALPYGVYKVDEGDIKSIKVYDGNTNRILTTDGFYKMIDTYGVLELDVDGSVKILDYEGTNDEEVEIDNLKEIVEEVETDNSDNLKETIESETKEIVVETERNIEEKNIEETKINIDIDSIKDIAVNNRNVLLIIVAFIFIIILILIFAKVSKKKNKKENLCSMKECRYNEKGKCTSNVKNRLNAECDEKNNYYYFEERE